MTPKRPHFRTVEEAARWAKEAFDRRWEANPDLQRRLEGKDRVVLFDVTDGEPWTMFVEGGRFTRYERYAHPHPDARVQATTADLLALFNREMPVVQAYLTGRVKVHARITDVLFVRNLISEIMARK